MKIEKILLKKLPTVIHIVNICTCTRYLIHPHSLPYVLSTLSNVPTRAIDIRSHPHTRHRLCHPCLRTRPLQLPDPRVARKTKRGEVDGERCTPPCRGVFGNKRWIWIWFLLIMLENLLIELPPIDGDHKEAMDIAVPQDPEGGEGEEKRRGWGHGIWGLRINAWFEDLGLNVEVVVMNYGLLWSKTDLYNMVSSNFHEMISHIKKFGIGHMDALTDASKQAGVNLVFAMVLLSLSLHQDTKKFIWFFLCFFFHYRQGSSQCYSRAFPRNTQQDLPGYLCPL